MEAHELEDGDKIVDSETETTLVVTPFSPDGTVGVIPENDDGERLYDAKEFVDHEDANTAIEEDIWTVQN